MPTLTFDSSFDEMFDAEARSIGRHPWVQRVLADRGVASVEELSREQKQKLVIKRWVLAKQQQHKRRQVEFAAEAAAQEVENAISTGVD